MDVIPFHPRFGGAVVELIVGIQRDEFQIDIDVESQPDLRQIPSYYQARKGNFWLAVSDGQVIGTVSLLDLGHDQAALRKMFVHRDYRGATSGTAKHLLDVLLQWAGERGLRDIYLGTTAKFLAAHRFYEKNGFAEVAIHELPSAFPLMAVDTKFYQRTLTPSAPAAVTAAAAAADGRGGNAA